MKKTLMAVIGVWLLLVPAALFAQSDGTVDSATQAPVQAAPIVQAPVPQAPAPRPRAVATPPTPVPVSAPPENVVPDPLPDPAPAPFSPWLSALAGAISALAVAFGLQAWMKKAKNKGAKKCRCCQGTGREQGVCATCKGTGTVEEEHEATVECPRCEGEGEEPCAQCKGEEFDDRSCLACRGEGTRDCTACFGEGEADITLKRNVACPDCKR